MRKLTLSILAGAAALAMASPASAAVSLCVVTGSPDQPQCGQTDVNVLVNQQTASAVTGVTAFDNDSGTNVTYRFTSSTETNLVQVASGQADVTSSDGVLNQITFTIEGGAASLVTFNLVPLGPQAPGTDATSVRVTLQSGAFVDIMGLNPTGQNFFGIQATGTDLITSLSFGGFAAPTGTNVGIQALNQVRLDLVGSTAVPAVPEPGTWAMMLLGFGAIGFSVRRKRGASLLQAA